MANLDEFRRAQRAEGTATILAIGTANPPNVIYQDDYPDFYFRTTNSEHLTDMKKKFKRICEKSLISKRYFHLNEDLLKENPNLCTYDAPSFDTRQDIVVVEIPKLAKAAAAAAIKEWGRPKSHITHLIFCTTSGVDMPGADYQLTKLLGLRPSVNRLMMYQQGCFAGGTVLRVAKDLAENARGARILVVCAEITLVTFRGPCEADLDGPVGQALTGAMITGADPVLTFCSPGEAQLNGLVNQALFGDGAGALIIGADPDVSVERPLFQLVSAQQTTVPESHGAIQGHLRETGLTVYLLKDVPRLVAKNIDEILENAFSPLGVKDWNSIFWVAHPGGPAIVDLIEEKLGLEKARMRATREVLKEYGNMSSACVMFVMDEMRKRSAEEGKATYGEGLDMGVLFGFGPGLTVECLVLKGCPIAA